MGLGLGTNNYAENMALKLLLCFAKEKECKSIQVFGDSMNAINWINKIQNCQNLFLLSLIEDVHRLVDSFDVFFCCHVYMYVYREQNGITNKLSKDGLLISFRQWKITAVQNKTFFEFYYCPFIDGLAPHQLHID